MSYFYKPITQTYSLQPSFSGKHENVTSNVEESPKSKPVAKISPIDNKKAQTSTQSVQTDEIIPDIDKIISLEDYQRSLRIVGRNNQLNNDEVKDEKITVLGLQKELQAQRQINQDLKKLLIASLGDELADMFAKLNNEVINLNDKVQSLLTEKVTVNDSADSLAIEVDIWRHKFLAGRHVLDELSQWKRQVELRHEEAIKAVVSLLREHHQLRLYLSTANSVLCSAIGERADVNKPQNTLMLAQRTKSLAVTLSELIRKLNPIDVGLDSNEYPNRITELTKAEEEAVYVLSNRNIPNQKFPTDRAISSIRSTTEKNLESMAFFVCRNCIGDIFVV